MTQVSIFGKGNMGQAIAAAFERAGQEVSFVEKGQAVTELGDIVVLAVPYAALADIAAANKAALAGKIVVDITNPVNFDTFDDLVVPADSSAAAELQALLPDSKVVKAFNTNFAATLASGQLADGVPTTVQVAGDDEAAKVAFAAALEGGLAVIDAGGLKRARDLEAMGFLQITLAAREVVDWTKGFAVYQ